MIIIKFISIQISLKLHINRVFKYLKPHRINLSYVLITVLINDLENI